MGLFNFYNGGCEYPINCESCKLVGQSHDITEYPKNCLFLNDIQKYERKQKQPKHAKKAWSIADVMAMLPTEKETEQYANGNFGYERGSDKQERAFMSGADWMRREIEQKLQGN